MLDSEVISKGDRLGRGFQVISLASDFSTSFPIWCSA